MERDEHPAEADAERDPGQAAAPGIRRLARPARRAFDAIVGGAGWAAEPIRDRVGHAIEGAERTWHERPGARVRRVRRRGKEPLPYLMEVHPEARAARPVQVGLRTIDVSDVAGTAVGGGDQRGGDFLPLKPFRGANWAGRWQRLRTAHERLADLPPIEVVKYGEAYWVVDGHNRVALALYGGQVGIDANIVELIPSGGRRTEPILSSAPSAAESRSLRTAGTGHRPAGALSREDSIDPNGLESGET